MIWIEELLLYNQSLYFMPVCLDLFFLNEIHNNLSDDIRDFLAFKIECQNNKCCYCGKEFTSDNRATIEHFVPKSKGGGDTIDNIRAACQWCNNRKGNVSKKQFDRKYPQWAREADAKLARK
jgi:5-methylcytosine-specific restriction endonuclease McrA